MRIALGLGLCLFALLIVLSFMQALQRNQFEDIRTFESFDLQIPLYISNYQKAGEMVQLIESIHGVDAAFVYADLPIIAQNKDGTSLPGRLRAIEGKGRFLDQLNSYRGNLFESDKISSSFSNSYTIRVSDMLNITYLRKGRQATVVPSQKSMEVGSIFYTSSYDFDRNTFLTDIPTILSLNPDLPLFIGIYSQGNVDELKKVLVSHGFTETQTWKEVNASLYGAMELEQKMMTIMLFLMVVVVLVHIRNSSRRLLLAKQREIAMLRSMGMTKTNVSLIFLMQAFIVSFVGLFAGMLLSYAAIAFYPFLSKIAYQAMGIHLILEIQIEQLLILVGSILVFSLFAAYLGTHRILKADIMEMFAHDEIN